MCIIYYNTTTMWYSFVSPSTFHTLQTLQQLAFEYAVILTQIALVLVYAGVISQAPEYISTLSYYVQLYAGVFLIWRFNPLRNVRMTKFDAMVAYNAGAALSMATIISIINEHTATLRAWIKRS